MVSTSECMCDVAVSHRLTMLNSPEWGRLSKQVYGPGEKYHWESAWEFGTI